MTSILSRFLNEAALTVTKNYLDVLLSIEANATALLLKVSRLAVAFNIQLHAIDHNLILLPKEKIRGYRELMKKYPQRQELLESLIAMQTTEGTDK